MDISKALEYYRTGMRYLAKRPEDPYPVAFSSYASALAYLKDHDPPSAVWLAEEEIVKILSGRFPPDMSDPIKIDMPDMTFYDLIALAEAAKDYFGRMREIGFRRS